DLRFLPLGPDGRLKHGVLEEQDFGVKADTRGRIIGLDRQDIVNDDIGALQSLIDMLGTGAGEGLNEEFWAEFLADHETFFTEDHGNYMEGADTALDFVGLNKGETLFMEKEKPNGAPLAVKPRRVLVPPSLSSNARALFDSQQVRPAGGTGGKATLTENTLKGRFEPVVSAYLKGSPKAWYLIADPARMASVEVAFLNGRQTPILEEAEPSADQLGIVMRGYFDYGIRKQEHLAIVKSKGEA
ncbi:MAG: Mu-like prophage major head subunit gpT family protein, partial [Planctomycetota bacterium]